MTAIAPIPTIEPPELTAGDTWTWQISARDFPSSAWVLAYVLAGATVLPWDPSFSVAQPDDSYLVTIPAATTQALPAGVYRMMRLFTSGTLRRSFELETRNVLEDPASYEPGDAQPWEEVELVVVRAAIRGQLTDKMQGYMIGGRQVQFIPLEELQTREAFLEARLVRLRDGGSDPLGQSVRFAFRPAWGVPDRGGWI